MAATQEPDTDELIVSAATGDGDARQQLLERHRVRLMHMVRVRLDRRVARRVDPSDIVQEALTLAHRRLDDYLIKRPIPIYPWLRQIAWDTLIKCHDRHNAGKRSVAREEFPDLSNESIQDLADRLIGSTTEPSERAIRAELNVRVRAALQELASVDREVLVMRYIEQLSTAETATVLGCSPNAVKVRLLRALRRLRDQLGD